MPYSRNNYSSIIFQTISHHQQSLVNTDGLPTYDQLARASMDEDDLDVINQNYYPMFPYVTESVTTPLLPPEYSDIDLNNDELHVKKK